MNLGSRIPPLRMRIVCWPDLRAAITGAHSFREIIDVSGDAWHVSRRRLVICVVEYRLVKKLGENVAIIDLITKSFGFSSLE